MSNNTEAAVKFLLKMAHLEDTAIQKIVLFGNRSSQYKGRKGGRKQTYISCLMLALANFGVTMEECMEMSQLDWEFNINDRALLEATAKWRAKPSAFKPIDNFWAPEMQTRGKRKRILADDEVDDGTEDLLPPDVASQAIVGVDNSADDRTAEQAGRVILFRVNYFRGRRQQSFKRLRSPHRVFSVQSTQDFSITEKNVTDEETAQDNLKERKLLSSRSALNHSNPGILVAPVDGMKNKYTSSNRNLKTPSRPLSLDSLYGFIFTF